MSSQIKIAMTALAGAASLSCGTTVEAIINPRAPGADPVFAHAQSLPKDSKTYQAVKEAYSDGKIEVHKMGIYLKDCPEAEDALRKDQANVLDRSSSAAAHAVLWAIARAPGQRDDEESQRLDEAYLASLVHLQNAVEGYSSTLYFAQRVCGGDEWVRKWPCPIDAIETLAVATLNLGNGAEQYIGTAGNPKVARDRNTFRVFHSAALGDGLLKGYKGARLLPWWGGPFPLCVEGGSEADMAARNRDNGWMEAHEDNTSPTQSIPNYVRHHKLAPWLKRDR